MNKPTSIQGLASLMAVPLAASMLLAGCGGDGKPDASSSTTGSSPSITATLPTATLPTATNTAAPKIDPDIPAAAKAHTPAGAEAFVRYFIERWNIAQTEPRAGILSPLCQPSSKACAALEETATRLAKEGHRYDGDPVSIKFIGALDSAAPNHLDVLANLVQERRSEIDASGKIYVTDARKDLQVDFDLLFTGQAWSVAFANPTK